MQASDRDDFNAVVSSALGQYPGTVDQETLNRWWRALKTHGLDDVRRAFADHEADPKKCRFKPRSGDILLRINSVKGLSEKRKRCRYDHGRDGYCPAPAEAMFVSDGSEYCEFHLAAFAAGDNTGAEAIFWELTKSGYQWPPNDAAVRNAAIDAGATTAEAIQTACEAEADYKAWRQSIFNIVGRAA